MNLKLVELWQAAHRCAQQGVLLPIDGNYYDPSSAIATMSFICKTLGVNEPPKECSHDYQPAR